MDDQRNDFVVNSKGLCFICLHNISSDKTTATTLHTLQCLAQYLKMDMTRVFSQKGSIPESLLTKVKQSRLKVEQCEECASLTKDFSVLFQHWEKLEMEMQSKLSHIQEKLQTSLKSQRCIVKSEGDEGINEVLGVLREEAMEKCTIKTGNPGPRIKIQKLTRKAIKAHLRIVNTNDKRASEGLTICNTGITQSGSQSGSHVQMESSQRENLTWNDEDNGNDDLHDMDANNDDEGSGMMMVKETGSVTEIHEGDRSEIVKVREEHLNKPNITTAAAAPSSSQTIGERKYSLDSKTGKYKCSLCSKRFVGRMGCQVHYDTVHLKVRYKCNLCGKTFSQKANYSTHLRSAHLGVRFKCLVCNQQFAFKNCLNRHQRKNSCKEGESL